MIANLKTFNHGVAWEASYGYSQGVSGQLAHDAEGKPHRRRGLRSRGHAHVRQPRQGARQPRRDAQQVVETTVMIVGLRENFGAVAAAHRSYFGDHRPASNALGVVELALPGQLLEVAAIVRLDLPE